MKNWYYSENSKPLGPVDLKELKALIFSGKVTEHTFLLNEAQGDWQPASQFAEVNPQWFQKLDERAFSADIQEDASWIFLIVIGTSQKQYGPFFTDAAKNFVKEHHHELQCCFVWQDGWQQWRSVTQVGELMLTNLQTEQKELLRGITEL